MSAPKAEVIPEVTKIEWAVQYRTYIDGKFERTVVYDSEDKARTQVEKFNKGKPRGEHARVAKRYVTKWSAG